MPENMTKRDKKAFMRKKVNRAKKCLEAITERELEAFSADFGAALKNVRIAVKALNEMGKQQWKGS